MSLLDRIKNDYFGKSRLNEYMALLEKAIKNGFSFVPLQEFSLGEKLVFLRHDIDTDVSIAKKMFSIEKKLGIRSTYYFRRSTMNKKLIESLKEFGCEVSYHFEEVSDYAYKYNLCDKKEIKAAFGKISEIFKKNLEDTRKKIGAPCVTIASHGDFVNRKVGVINNEFLTTQLRNECGILYEAYDSTLMDATKYCSDGNAKFMELSDFSEASRYYLLVHPRSWDSGFLNRLCIDIKRAIKGLKFKLGCKIHKVLKTVKEILALPKEQLIFEGENNISTYKHFTKRHPKYKVFRNKTLGACLLEKPETFDGFLVGKEKQVIRTKRNKCIKMSYTFSPISVADNVKDILEINSSKQERQGNAMNPSYSDAQAIVENAKDKDCFGVFNAEGKLISYCYLINAGDFIIISRLLGHSDYLNDGIMHYMISECIRLWLNGRWNNARYFFYDTWFGAGAGLRNFKTDLGFKPYRVKYKYRRG